MSEVLPKFGWPVLIRLWFERRGVPRMACEWIGFGLVMCVAGPLLAVAAPLAVVAGLILIPVLHLRAAARAVAWKRAAIRRDVTVTWWELRKLLLCQPHRKLRREATR